MSPVKGQTRDLAEKVDLERRPDGGWEGGREGLAGGALRYHEKARALYVHRLASALQHYRVVANRSEWKLRKNWGTSADVTARRGKKNKKNNKH